MSRKFGGIDCGEMRKIEAQARGLDERAGLLDVRAENVAKRGVHQVRPSVVALDVFAARAVGIARDEIAYGEFFSCDDAMRDQAGDWIVCAAHFGDRDGVLVVPERADVGNLSAGFGVEDRAIQDNFAFRAGWEFVYRAVLCDDGFDAAIFRARLEIKIRLRAIPFRKFRVHRIRDVLVPALPRCACTGPLILHCLLERGPINLEASVMADVFNEVAGQTIGIVELKGFFAGKFAGRKTRAKEVLRRDVFQDICSAYLVYIFFEFLKTDVDRSTETGFFFIEDLVNASCRLQEFRIRSGHECAYGV